MNKTENLKLNVWEKSDPILVGDFNENFAAIDDAIGKAGKLVKLKEYVVESDTKQFDVDVSDINWAEWQGVHVDIKSTVGSNAVVSLDIALNTNAYCYRQYMGSSSNSGNAISSISTSMADGYADARMILLTMHHANHLVKAVTFEARTMSYGGAASLMFRDLTNLRFSSSIFIKSGSSVTIWGEK